MSQFDRDQFEKDLIKEILKIQDKLGKKYNIKFSIDVTWQLKDDSKSAPVSSSMVAG